MYICEKCNKRFKSQRNLNLHLNKKLPCDRKYVCDDCGKAFCVQWKYKRHIKRKRSCIPIQLNVQSNIATQSNLSVGDNAMIDNSVTHNTITNSGNIINNGGTINLNFQIRNFRCEDKAPLTKELMDKIMAHPLNAPVKLFRLLNLNPNFPQNHNVVIPNKKLPYAQIKTKDGWESKHIDEVNWDIMNNVEFLMDKEYNERCDKMEPSNRERVERILNDLNMYVDYNEVKESAKKWENDIICALTDSKEMVLATKKLLDNIEKFKQKCERQAKWEQQIKVIEEHGEQDYEEYEKLYEGDSAVVV